MARRKRPERIAAAGEDGQGIGYVLVIGTVLLIFLVALVKVLTSESQFIVAQSKKLSNIHGADAAIDRGLYALQMGTNWDDIPDGVVGGYSGDSIYTDQPGILYKIVIQEGNWTPGMETGDTKNQRTITVFLSNTLTGDKKKVQAVVRKAALNAALFSQGNVSLGGSIDINWGPVVSYSTASDSLNAYWYPDHPIYKSKGGVIIPKGETPSPCMYASAQVPCYQEDSDLGEPPSVPMGQLRSKANEQGTYYMLTNCKSPNPLPATHPGGVVFYDTCTGADYDPLVHSVCKASCSGGNDIGVDLKIVGGSCGYGTLVIMGDLNMGGNGNCPTETYVAPPDCSRYDRDSSTCPPTVVTSDKLFWDGFIYVAGNLSGAGTKQIYGTLYAFGTSGVTGNWSLWYKADNESVGYTGQSSFIELWMERKPADGDLFP